MSYLQSFLAWLKSLFTSAVEKELRPVITGFIKGEADSRDHVYTDAFGTVYGVQDENLGFGSLPLSVDLTGKMSPVEDQGPPNTCVGHVTASAFEAIFSASDRSRLFTYYNARVLANQTGYDAGCTIRNALRAISTKGLAAEPLWPYDLSKLTVRPSAEAYADGAPNAAKIASYATITSFDSFKIALSNGLPVLFGFMVPASFRTTTKSTGIQQLKQPGEAIIGGHCVLAVGFDDATQLVKVRNSFGTAWGKEGYFYMPYAWFVKLGQPFGNLILDPWVMVPRV